MPKSGIKKSTVRIQQTLQGPTNLSVIGESATLLNTINILQKERKFYALSLTEAQNFILQWLKQKE